MRRLRLIINEPSWRDFLPLAFWFVLLLVLALLHLETLWVLLLAGFLYFRALRWAVHADKQEKFDRDWTALMGRMEEADELHGGDS